MRKYTFGNITAVVMFIACLLIAAQTVYAASPADTALRTAAKHQRYAFVTFYRPNDATSMKMLAAVKSIEGKLADRADFVSVDMSNQANWTVISRYGANRSPMPLTIVVAPNGAVTAGYPTAINVDADFSGVFVSPGQAAVLKVMQESRIAVVCLQNEKTKYNSECTANANALRKDQRVGSVVTLVTIDPADPAEAKFMQQAKIDTNSPNARIVVFAAPGKVIGTFDGNTPPATISASLQRSLGGGCSGGQCGPGGCH